MNYNVENDNKEATISTVYSTKQHGTAAMHINNNHYICHVIKVASLKMYETRYLKFRLL